jgi:hypothetical protein
MFLASFARKPVSLNVSAYFAAKRGKLRLRIRKANRPGAVRQTGDRWEGRFTAAGSADSALPFRSCG